MSDPPAKARGRRAVVVLASGEAAETADRLRRRFDAEWFERVPPHVSLVEPFDPARVGVDEEIARRMREAVSGVEPFQLELGRPGAFVAPALILYLSVTNDCAVRDLQDRARRALGVATPPRQFVPHLTVGRAHSQEGLASALAALRAELARRPEGAGPLVFPVEEVSLFGEDPETGVYSSLATAPLGGTTRGAAAN
ncbi:MAG: 2'-5' RNA ligase family protein [Planctomycetota bacterium]